MLKKHFKNISASCLHQFIYLKITVTILFIQFYGLKQNDYKINCSLTEKCLNNTLRTLNIIQLLIIKIVIIIISEVAIESSFEWDSNSQPLSSVQKKN